MAFQVEFVSPERILYSDRAIQVVARTRGGGEIAFLTGHEPFIGSLVPCEVRVTEEAAGEVKRFAVRGGFVSLAGTMTESKLTVLSDAAIPADQIDRAAVEAELAAANQARSSDPDDPEVAEEVTWAEVRLATAAGA